MKVTVLFLTRFLDIHNSKNGKNKLIKSMGWDVPGLFRLVANENYIHISFLCTKMLLYQ